MATENREFSLEGVLGLAAACFGPLIKPDEPIWRLFCLLVGGGLLLIAIRKTKWANQANPIISLSGEPADDMDMSGRKLLLSILVISTVAVFGLLSWPLKTTGGIDGFILTGQTAQIEFHPTKNGILPSKPSTQSTGPSGNTAVAASGDPGKPKQSVIPPPPAGLHVISVQ